ncbi:GNAT family N-acetyltransferase [Flammeovirga kamogawensis]|uniref:GNAT family N-acetyltransferase n=1 Tax=Flammeovirga kamogawensis TaxID=373891 RepID=A0ABX8GUQ6_9BACT|nr:GNAT family N-acetyltransferase [Flammeovirga kamogawensis]MBB6459805.1 putative acetyltransferase [Flammeovirga kamogawensis]QWG07139.1 GNAT family N-acetyltransferase [Flammeovirga kamogawensis]
MYSIRVITPNDNAFIEKIIKEALEEHNAALPGTAYFDKQLGELSKVYEESGVEYFILEENNKVIGGAGIGKLIGADDSVCELQKIYLSTDARGKGYGEKVLKHCLTFAKDEGYSKCYLETMPELVKGVALYERLGFKNLEAPLGNTSHHSCTIWMIKEL